MSPLRLVADLRRSDQRPLGAFVLDDRVHCRVEQGLVGILMLWPRENQKRLREITTQARKVLTKQKILEDLHNREVEYLSRLTVSGRSRPQHGRWVVEAAIL